MGIRSVKRGRWYQDCCKTCFKIKTGFSIEIETIMKLQEKKDRLNNLNETVIKTNKKRLIIIRSKYMRLSRDHRKLSVILFSNSARKLSMENWPRQMFWTTANGNKLKYRTPSTPGGVAFKNRPRCSETFRAPPVLGGGLY